MLGSVLLQSGQQTEKKQGILWKCMTKQCPSLLSSLRTVTNSDIGTVEAFPHYAAII